MPPRHLLALAMLFGAIPAAKAADTITAAGTTSHATPAAYRPALAP